MKRKILIVVFAVGSLCAPGALVNESNDFWDTTAYENFTPVPRSSASVAEVSGTAFVSVSVWKRMAEMFNTLVKGLTFIIR